MVLRGVEDWIPGAWGSRQKVSRWILITVSNYFPYSSTWSRTVSANNFDYENLVISEEIGIFIHIKQHMVHKFIEATVYHECVPVILVCGRVRQEDLEFNYRQKDKFSF